MKDVFSSEKRISGKNNKKKLVGYNIHLNWKQGSDSVFFLPYFDNTHLVKAQEINQFVFMG